MSNSEIRSLVNFNTVIIIKRGFNGYKYPDGRPVFHPELVVEPVIQTFPAFTWQQVRDIAKWDEFVNHPYGISIGVAWY